MHIELANLADAQGILELQKLAYLSEAAIYNDYSIPPLTQTIDQMRADFRDRTVLKAVIDGKIAGSVRGFMRDGTCHIERLIVHPERQNRGIGKKLLKSIEERFNEAQRYVLFTGERSERNLYLYQKAGYCAFRTELLNEKTNIVFMEKLNPVAPAPERCSL